MLKERPNALIQGEVSQDNECFVHHAQRSVANSFLQLHQRSGKQGGPRVSCTRTPQSHSQRLACGRGGQQSFILWLPM